MYSRIYNFSNNTYKNIICLDSYIVYKHKINIDTDNISKDISKIILYSNNQNSSCQSSYGISNI